MWWHFGSKSSFKCPRYQGFQAKFNTSRPRIAMLCASSPTSQWISAVRAQIALKIHRIASGFVLCTLRCKNRCSDEGPDIARLHIVGCKNVSHRRLASCDLVNVANNLPQKPHHVLHCTAASKNICHLVSIWGAFPRKHGLSFFP